MVIVYRDQIRVIYVIDCDDDVTAIFMDIPGNTDPLTMQCYAHIGQHSYCSMQWYSNDTKDATPKQFKSLHQELLKIYDDSELYIMNKIDKDAKLNRIAAISRIYE